MSGPGSSPVSDAASRPTGGRTQAEVLRGQTPAQTVGPFFHDALMRDASADLDPRRQAGAPVRVEGRILDGAGEPVGDAMVEVWQASGAGRYTHPLDEWPDDLSTAFLGFGRIATASDGSWHVTTAMPGPVPGRDGDTQAPHLNLQVFARGLLDLVSTRIYFDGHPANADDPVLATVPVERRPTLLAQPVDGDEDAVAVYRFDVVLRGPSQTVFFDV